MHQLRHTAPLRTAAEQSLQVHFQPHRTGDDRAAHGGAGPGRSAAPLCRLHNRGRSGFAPVRASRGSRCLTRSRLRLWARRRAPALSHPSTVRTALAGPGTAEPRCPQRPAVCPRPAARHPPPLRHPRRIPAEARPAAPRRSRCLAPSRPPQLPARLTEGAGSRVAPQPRRAAPRPRPPPRCPPLTHLPRGRGARQEGMGGLGGRRGAAKRGCGRRQV